MNSVARVARHHWFYLVAPILLGIALSFRATYPWAAQPRLGEAATLFDWCLFVPFLYAICYREMPRRALIVRILALVCGGVGIAGKIVPESAQTILSHWGWLRGVGIAALALAEAGASIVVLRVVFGSAPDPQELERQGIPPLLAKLMLIEARFWRRVWARLRGE